MRKSKTKEVDIIDMLTPDMAKAMDMLAYAFLKQQGYDTTDCDLKNKQGKAARKKLERRLRDDGRELKYHLPTKDNRIFCYFSLVDNKGNKLAESRAIEFICQEININQEGIVDGDNN